MQRLREAQAVTAHNLANLATPGFRREMVAFQPGHLVPVPADAALPTRVQAGGETRHDLLRAGRLETTGRALDVAPEGGTWLVVEAKDGGEALTRRGDLRIAPDGTLVTGDGHPVVGTGGSVRLAAGLADVRIGADGRVETRAAPDQPFVEVDRLKLVSPDPATLVRGTDGLFRPPAPLSPDPLASVVPGALERSNVELAQALVELVEQARAFEVQAKLLETAREADEQAAQLMRVSG